MDVWSELEKGSSGKVVPKDLITVAKGQLEAPQARTGGGGGATPKPKAPPKP